MSAAVETKAQRNGVAQASEPTVFERLREPFAPERISKLPQRSGTSAESYRNLPRSHCKECGGYHPREHTIHLDYVGHADVTDRLLAVDPRYEFTYSEVDEAGRPSLQRSTIPQQGGGIALAMRLTIDGVSHVGVGYGSGEEALKNAESDALRRCAMRFGVALDLWRKDGLEPPQEAAQRPAAAPPASSRPEAQARASEPQASEWKPVAPAPEAQAKPEEDPADTKFLIAVRSAVDELRKHDDGGKRIREAFNQAATRSAVMPLSSGGWGPIPAKLKALKPADRDSLLERLYLAINWENATQDQEPQRDADGKVSADPIPF